MKKVLVYGINNRPLLSRIGQWLSEKYQIIGYLDDDSSIVVRYFSNKVLYSVLMVENKKVDFDYIILASGVGDEEIKQRIISAGVKASQILEWSLISEFLFENNMILYKKRCMDYEGFIFGMSHSYWGLLTSELSRAFFKFSTPANDLFYINKQLQEVLNENYLGKKGEGIALL